MPNPIAILTDMLVPCLEQGTFLKLTLSQAAANEEQLRNVYLRPVLIKQKPMLSFTYRYAKKDIVKNYAQPEALAEIERLATQLFAIATLFTAQNDCIFKKNKKGEWLLQKTQAASTTEQPSLQHNQSKHYLIPENAPFLQPLGIANKDGKIIANQYDKYKQINKYIEIIDSLLKDAELPNPFSVADMGCGKGYLTFALYFYLQQKYPQLSLDIKGIELRLELVDYCNKIAKELNYHHLQFIQKNIQDFSAEGLSMLIALHACDTATDLAIAQGIRLGAQWIITAPCCHRQIRREMHCQSDLQPILKHGILEERQAEIVTDGIRALLQESAGYKTRVFEFISNEHTAKNVMITAVRGLSSAPKSEALAQVAAIKQQFGIREHYLETLLKSE